MGIALKSDFVDYYDSAFERANIASNMTYNRILCDSMSKGRSLRWLREHGIPTIEAKPVSSIFLNHNKLVIYTDPKKHGGEGKILCSSVEAYNMYGNYLSSGYIEGTNGMTLKLVQVGSRRFRVMLRYKEESLSEYSIESIDELPRELNYIVGIPIFSIDYIPVNQEVIAVDFNEVQKLGNLGFNKIMPPNQVVDEVIQALVAYTK